MRIRTLLFTSISLSISVGDAFIIQDACKSHNGRRNNFFSVIMALVMGIVSVLRLARNMPRKLTEATIYSSPDYSSRTIKEVVVVSSQFPAPTISSTEYMSVLTRLADLEDKMRILSEKPAAVMPSEKEEMLNAALSRVDVLEQELSKTKKVIINKNHKFPFFLFHFN